MVRDSHFAGLPLGLDVNRLIAKLEIVAVTPQNAPNPSLAAQATNSPNNVLYEMGIAHNAMNAYEKLLVGRVFLYDTLYYHHKVRTSEAMVRQLIELVEEERGATFSVRECFEPVGDDAMLAVLGGTLKTRAGKGVGERAVKVAGAIRNRLLYRRAFAMSSRFITGMDGRLPEEKG